MTVWKDAGTPLVVSLVTTHDGEGRVNASPKSWWTPTSYDPPLLIVAVKPGSDTQENIERNGMFCLHVPPTADAEFVKQVLHTAKPLPYGDNELDDVGLRWRWQKHPEMSKVEFATVDGVPYFGCMVSGKWQSGDHVVYEGRVVLSALGQEGEELGIRSVMLHRGMNRFVGIGIEYEVERY